MINLILAVNEDGSLGWRNRLLYPDLKHDMQHFRETTTYNEYGLKNFVIMGRNTFHSLKNPLKDRINVVLTTNRKFTVDDPHVIVSHSIENIINQYQCGTQDKELFCIGGGMLYEQFIPFTDKIFLTYIYDSGRKADTYFDFNLLNDFIEVEKESFWSDEYQCEYDFIAYKRKGGVID